MWKSRRGSCVPQIVGAGANPTRASPPSWCCRRDRPHTLFHLFDLQVRVGGEHSRRLFGHQQPRTWRPALWSKARRRRAELDKVARMPVLYAPSPGPLVVVSTLIPHTSGLRPPYALLLVLRLHSALVISQVVLTLADTAGATLSSVTFSCPPSFPSLRSRGGGSTGSRNRGSAPPVSGRRGSKRGLPQARRRLFC